MADNAAIKVQQQLNEAYRRGFGFAEKEKTFRRLSNQSRGYLDNLGDEVSPSWTFWWIPSALAAIGLGVFGAFSAQGAIAGLVDPSGEGTIPQHVLAMIGTTLSIVGITIGHLLHESFQTHPYSGERSIRPVFWVYASGALFYVGFQFLISKTAGGDVSTGQFIGLRYMPLVIAGIAMIELLYGVFLANRVIIYMLIFTIALRQRRATRQMNKNARATHNAYGYYMTLLEEYHRTANGRQIEQEGNANVRRALAYYSGIATAAEQPTNEVTGQSTAQDTRSPENHGRNTNQSISETRGTTNSQHNNQSDLDSFVDDSIDDDLKA